MSLFKKQNASSDCNNANWSDADLVMASLGGDRNAFCEIVTRYQNLLCALAYSAVGDLKHSEDIAQETFIEAWKKLDTLRDPEKLKSWLCGILRFKTSHFRRKEAAQPVADAHELDEYSDEQSAQTKIEDDVISAQEQALLWQALEKMPDTYREPLILFYREQCSVEHVADQLELTEDTVKQRLSRGRKLLQQAMVNFVEDTLTKSKQGTAFTLSVLAAINDIAPAIKVATFSTGAAKAAAIFKWGALLAVMATASGFISSFFGLRAALDQSRTKRERKQIIFYVTLYFVFTFVYILGMMGLQYTAEKNFGNAVSFSIISQLLVAALAVIHISLTIKMLRAKRKLRMQERLLHPEAFQDPVDHIGYKRREYKSHLYIAGVPLIHVRFGIPEQGDKPLVAWFAGGSHAYGLVFAWGGIAIAPISVGIISVGAIGIGAVGVGLLGMGTVAIGVIGFGASSIAFKAYGSLSALGWESALSGGFSIAHEAAIGAISFAKHINNEQAAEIVSMAIFQQSYLWMLAALTVLVVVPAILYSNNVRKHMTKKSSRNTDNDHL
ncbi:sigma-70 family RNA polymerase sigma factor [Cellvibrio sp. NN19]|uniref:RNA polymerase sigma factor n=1 Tax=Cellvibrio chitinivorans TaxID=3102792 RepID=UPI002B40A528|nr:sigma-70 family RNA polymerase sigma factor [Cellvibrio sp. NN19]